MTSQTTSTVGREHAAQAGSLGRTALVLALATLAALLLAGCALDRQPAGFTPGSAVAPDAAQANAPQKAARVGDITARVALTVPAGTVTPEPVIKGSPSRWVTDTIHPIEYRGLVQMLPSSTMTGTMTGTWTIGGHAVNVGPGTDVKLQLGKLEAGAYVQVIGWLQPDGSIDAFKILVKKLNPGQGKAQPPTGGVTNTMPFTNTLPGVIRPGDDESGGAEDSEEPEDQADGNRNWDVHVHGLVAGAVITNTGGLSYTLTVNGQQVIVDATTWLKAGREPADGDWLQVKGLLQPDGTILATSIQWVHRVPGQPGKSGAAQFPAVTTTPVPGLNAGQGGVKIVPPGKSGGPGNGQGTGPGKAPTHRPSTKPDQGNGNSNGNGNGHK